MMIPKSHNKFCFHECLQLTKMLKTQEFELYQILDNVDGDSKLKNKIDKKLRKLQRDLFHISIGHGNI